MKKSITILQLYPKDMNIYGDYGNTLTLRRRLQWMGFDARIKDYNPGDRFPKDIDVIVGGGGQDSGQNKIQEDLLKIAPKLQELANNDVPMLMICGLYQMFGKFFKTADGTVIKGIGLLDVETYAKSERLIGNIVTDSAEFGEILGYENHSGQTFLGKHTKPLATVRVGAGNNLEDKGEGARYRNVIGSYLHGSLLPKNPRIADFLLQKAIANKYDERVFEVPDDHFAQLARKAAVKRPR